MRVNREIKFRAWDKAGNEWLFGYEYPNLGGFSMFGEVMLMHEYSAEMNKRFPDGLEDVVLMQYTGLKDKNGVEIYEGDILRHHMHRLSDNEPIYIDTVVEWTENVGYDDPGIGYQLNPGEMKVVEVIGNIYENGDLLK